MFNQAKEFLILMGQFDPIGFDFNFRQELHEEELMGVGELIDSILSQNRLGVADGLADLAYVVMGTAVLTGIESIECQWNDEISEFTLSEAIAWLSSEVTRLPVQSIGVGIPFIMSCLYRIAELQGVDLDVAFSIAHENNMSKATKNRDEAMESAATYEFLTEVIERHVGDDIYYVIRSATDDQPKAPKGKILKPLSWVEPDYTSALLTTQTNEVRQ